MLEEEALGVSLASDTAALLMGVCCFFAAGALALIEVYALINDNLPFILGRRPWAVAPRKEGNERGRALPLLEAGKCMRSRSFQWLGLVLHFLCCSLGTLSGGLGCLVFLVMAPIKLLRGPMRKGGQHTSTITPHQEAAPKFNNELLEAVKGQEDGGADGAEEEVVALTPPLLPQERSNIEAAPMSSAVQETKLGSSSSGITEERMRELKRLRDERYQGEVNIISGPNIPKHTHNTLLFS